MYFHMFTYSSIYTYKYIFLDKVYLCTHKENIYPWFCAPLEKERVHAMSSGSKTPVVLDKHCPHPASDNLVKIREETNVTNREEVE